MEKLKRLGDAELEIMLAVWGAGEPVQSTYIHEKLKGSRDWALPAVITSLNRLVDKGFLACEKRGRSNWYRPWWRRGPTRPPRAGSCWTGSTAAASAASPPPWWTAAS